MGLQRRRVSIGGFDMVTIKRKTEKKRDEGNKVKRRERGDTEVKRTKETSALNAGARRMSEWNHGT